MLVDDVITSIDGTELGNDYTVLLRAGERVGERAEPLELLAVACIVKMRLCFFQLAVLRSRRLQMLKLGRAKRAGVVPRESRHKHFGLWLLTHDAFRVLQHCTKAYYALGARFLVAARAECAKLKRVRADDAKV